MEKYSKTENIVQHVQNKRVHHLLVLLRKRAFNQIQLDHALHVATRTGQVDIARLLIEHGANLRSLNAKGAPVLLGAVLGDHVDIITLLIICRYDLNYAVGDSIDTGLGVPLHIAIWKQNLQMIRVLVAGGIALETRDQDGNTPLLVSAYVKNATITAYLLKSGCVPNAQDISGNTIMHIAVAVGSTEILEIALKYTDPDIENDDGDTAFLICIRYDNRYMLIRLLEAGSNIAHINNEGCNGIHCACVYASTDTLSLLLDYEFDLNQIDIRGNSPLLAAAALGRIEMVQLLVPLLDKTGINKAGQSKRTLFHWSVVHNIGEIFRFCVDCHCFNLEDTDQNWDTVLMLAVHHGRYEMVKALVENGAETAPRIYEEFCPIHVAIETGNIAIVNVLIMHGANMHSVNKHIENSLVMAVRCGQTEIVRHILRYVADIDLPLLLKQKDVERCSGLHISVANGYIEILTILLPFYKKHAQFILESTNRCFETALAMAGRFYNSTSIDLLLDYSCNPNVLDKHGFSPLFHTVHNKSLSTFQNLLSCGADPNFCVKDTAVLIEAAKIGLVEFVQALLAKEAQINARDVHGRTALMWSSQKGYKEIIDILLAQGSDPSLCDNTGDTALTIAAFAGTLQALERLLPISDIESREQEENMTALLLALSQSHKDCALSLIKSGADINRLAKNGNNALITAAAANIDANVLDCILHCGQTLNIDMCGDMGRTALHWAVVNTRSLKVLLAANPSLDIMDDNGATPLLLAIAHDEMQSASLLVEAGCNINLVYNDGRQPVHHAAIYGRDALLERLLKLGIEADLPAKDGRTPLLLSAIEGHAKCVQVLVKFGAKVNTIFFDAVTPLSVSANEKHYDVMDILLTSGADTDLIGRNKHRPLVNCILNNDIMGVERLLMWGADIDFFTSWMVHPLVIAAMNRRWNILRLLLAATQSVNVVRNILGNQALMFFITDPSVLKSLKSFVKQPVTLEKLTRLVIRRHIARPLLTNIAKLPIPNRVKTILISCNK